jgi:hypothetical protein
MAASAPVLWTFAHTTTAAWYSAADTSTITASSNLATQWNEKKGNGINLAASGSQRPTLVSNVQNGRSILRLNGTSNFMFNSSAAMMRGVSGATLIMVCRRAANVASAVTMLSIATTGPSTRALLGMRNAANGASNEGLVAGGRRLAANTFQGAGNSAYSSSFIIAIAVFDYSAATLTVFQNGTQTATRSFQTAGVTENNAGQLYIGSNADGLSAFFNGDIAEAAVIHSAVGTTLRQQAEGYLGHEWGINGSLATGHPFLTLPPYL